MTDQIDPGTDPKEVQRYYSYLKSLIKIGVTSIIVSLLCAGASIFSYSKNFIASIIFLVSSVFFVCLGIFMLVSTAKKWYAPYNSESTPLNV